MFEHLLAGELVFLYLGKLLGFDISPLFLILGAFWGFSPDILSFFLSRRINYHSKNFFKHRNNLSHSLLLPTITFLVTLLFGGWKVSLLISAAVLTHPLLDLFGIGEGVKLFLPFSNKAYKLFYKGKIIFIFNNDKEIREEVRESGQADWFKRAYFTANANGVVWWWGIFEWCSLALAIYLPLLYFLKERYFY